MKNTEPAFPTKYLYNNCGVMEEQYEQGMTLRDYFAGQALMGLLGNNTFGIEKGDWSVLLSEDCYKAADAMVKERNK